MRRLWALLVKEFIQMRRDRLTFGMMAGIPVMQLFVFGFAINTDVKHLPTVVFDQDPSRESRELLAAFEASGYFDIVDDAHGHAGMDDALQSGRAKVGIVIPPDFSRRLRAGRTAPVQVAVDATDSMSASSAISTATLIGEMQSRRITTRRLGAAAPPPPYDVKTRAWYNPDFITAFYMIPGLMGVILTMTMVMATSMAIVREEEQGTMEQLLVTPLRTWELMLGKIIPYAFVGYAQITISLAVGFLVFDLPMRGSVGLLYLLSSLFIGASLALGILVSTLARTQMQAMQMSFFVFLPSVLLSGFMFPREAMPPFFRLLGNVVPLTFFLQILRSIVLKGVGAHFLWSQISALVAFIIVLMLAAAAKFRRRA